MPDGVDLLFFSRDPGATNQLAALAHYLGAPLNDRPASVQRLLSVIAAPAEPGCKIVGREYALRVWRNDGCAAQDFDALYGALPDLSAQIDALLDDMAPRAIVTGLDDVDEPRSRLLWRRAAERGVPTAALADNSANLAIRCRDAGGSIFPDHLFLLDQASADEMTAAGFPPARICRTDNLFLRRLGEDAGDDGRDYRARLGVAPEAAIFLYASENVAEMNANGRVQDWCELRTLERFLDGDAPEAAAIVGRFTAAERVILVRPHPREAAGKYDALIRRRRERIIVSDAGRPQHAIAAADLVLGVHSSLLDEAEIARVPVLRLQPYRLV